MRRDDDIEGDQFEYAHPSDANIAALFSEDDGPKDLNPLDFLQRSDRGEKLEAIVASFLRQGFQTMDMRQMLAEYYEVGLYDSLGLLARAVANEEIVEMRLQGYKADEIEGYILAAYGPVFPLMDEVREKRPDLFRLKESPLDVLRKGRTKPLKIDQQQWEEGQTSLLLFSKMIRPSSSLRSAGAPAERGAEEAAGSVEALESSEGDAAPDETAGEARGGDAVAGEETSGAEEGLEETKETDAAERASASAYAVDGELEEAYLGMDALELVEFAVALARCTRDANAFSQILAGFALDLLVTGRAEEVQRRSGFDAEFWAKTMEFHCNEDVEFFVAHYYAWFQIVGNGGQKREVDSLLSLLRNDSPAQQEGRNYLDGQELADFCEAQYGSDFKGLRLPLVEMQDSLKEVLALGLPTRAGDPSATEQLVETKLSRVSIKDALLERADKEAELSFGKAIFARTPYDFRRETAGEVYMGQAARLTPPEFLSGEFPPEDWKHPNRTHVHMPTLTEGFARALGQSGTFSPASGRNTLFRDRDRPLREMLWDSRLETHLPEPRLLQTNLGREGDGMRYLRDAWKSLQKNPTLSTEDKSKVIYFYDKYLTKATQLAEMGARAPSPTQKMWADEQEEIVEEIDVDDKDDAMDW